MTNNMDRNVAYRTYSKRIVDMEGYQQGFIIDLICVFLADCWPILY